MNVNSKNSIPSHKRKIIYKSSRQKCMLDSRDKTITINSKHKTQITTTVYKPDALPDQRSQGPVR